MITAILDSNIIVQAVISSPASASARTLDFYHGGKFQLHYSPAILDEWMEVLTVPRIRARHGMTDDELLEFLASVLINARRFPGETAVSAQLSRDITDTKFLALAAESHADFLVTNDRRHLLPLKKFQDTKIVTPRRFLAALG